MEKYIRTITRVFRLENNDISLIEFPKYLRSIDKVVDLGIKKGKYLKQITYTIYLSVNYETLVNNLVRERYTESEEFAILRKAINGITDEFLNYNAYVEECKVKAKEFIAERERVVNE